MIPVFELKITPTFTKIAINECRRTAGLDKKLKIAYEKIKSDPFREPKVKNSVMEERRIWVGESHRLFYLVINNQIIPTDLRKKDKNTYS